MSWVTDGPVTSPFAAPRGVLGRLAGRVMLWTNRQDELLEILRIGPGERVLEVGYGPGALIRLMADRTEASVILGVDPSPEMRALAGRTNGGAVRAGRVRLALGSAEHTGLPEESVDRAISVNNVAIWPDLDAGLRELHRVVRRDGVVIIAWHGGTAPSRMAERLRLPEDKLSRVEDSLDRYFRTVTRRQLRTLDVFEAIR